jgi:hypothetical protein
VLGPSIGHTTALPTTPALPRCYRSRGLVLCHAVRLTTRGGQHSERPPQWLGKAPPACVRAALTRRSVGDARTRITSAFHSASCQGCLQAPHWCLGRVNAPATLCTQCCRGTTPCYTAKPCISTKKTTCGQACAGLLKMQCEITSFASKERVVVSVKRHFYTPYVINVEGGIDAHLETPRPPFVERLC